jgi:diguanylate cyclase (GGDEF)-like protein
MQQSLIQALGIINCSILKRIQGRSFEVVHCNKNWFYALAPEAKGHQTFELAQSSVFLVDFLLDAEDFWQIGNDGQIQSGIWTEQSNDQLLRLEAIAAVTGGECYLIINNLEMEYSRQQKTLQVARELLISNDKVLAQHEYIHARLDEVLRINQNFQSIQEPISKVIEHADFGVLICDAKLNVISQNPNAFSIFELDKDNPDINPLDITVHLFEKQCPEYIRVIETGSHWHGELFWHKPPFTSKWLQIAIYPVKDDIRNVRNWVFIISDVSRIKYLMQRNEKLSLYDNVTDLPNRQFFWQTLEQSIEHGEPFFVLYLDIKHFKHINESHGHPAGDKLLVDLSQRLLPFLNQGDLCARIGGNEFGVILFSQQEQQECVQFAKRLIESVELPFYTEAHQKIQVGINIGAAHFPTDSSESEDLMKFADLALFSAKSSYKSSIKFYSKALKEASQKRLEMEASLRQAIEEGRFELYLQPILDLDSGEINKAEALIRWIAQDGTLINPDEFIPLAEQTGLIVPIGKWVIKRACEILKVLIQHKPNIKVSVNLSPRQIADKNLLPYISSMIETYGVPAQNLELELTEGVLIDNFDKVQRLLNEVRKMGISLSIDDFGTGYSSLAYLQKLPIDHLKIDRSFVCDLENNENGKALVLAMIAMAHSLKLGVIAEGVENIAQKNFLIEHSCETAQGFLFSKPLTFFDFQQLMIVESKRKQLNS